MKGILTDCMTEEIKEIELEYKIISTQDGRKIFQLIGGPTGYESFYIDPGTVKRLTANGWMACLGTKNLWNKLFIPSEEMKKVKEFDTINCQSYTRRNLEQIETQENHK